MKKIYIVILALMPLIGWAQPTITNMEVMPVGSTYTMLNDSTMGVNSGASGANQTWHFGSVIPTIPNSSSTTTSIMPSTATYIDSFPTANLVLTNGTQFQYYMSYTDSLLLLGAYDPTNHIVTYYPNPEKSVQRPFTYLSNYSENFSRHYYFNGMNQGTGTITATADAWGTITTPVTTYSNCLRVRIHQLDIDTAVSFGYVTTTNTYTWAWFDGVHFAPVFTIDSIKSVILTDTIISYSAMHLTSETAGITEVQQDKTFALAFPNPNNGQFTLAYHLTTPSAVLQIKDITGRMVHSEVISGVFGNAVINSQNFSEATPAGIYMWEIVSNDGVLAQGKISIK
jgi:hypothetical protein